MSDSDCGWDDDDYEPPVVESKAAETKKTQSEFDDVEVAPVGGYAAMSKEELIKEIEKRDRELETAKKIASGQVGNSKKMSRKLIKQKDEEERLRRLELEEEIQELTPEEKYARKLAQQKLEEDSDLKAASDLFGVEVAELEIAPAVVAAATATSADTGADVQAVTLIEAMEPATPDDFDRFRQAIVKKVIKYKGSYHYQAFAENLTKDVANELNAEGAGKVSKALAVLINEKQKAERGPKKGNKAKAKGKANVTVKKGPMNFDDDFIEDDFDDFM